jgi:hypothetical protein
MERDGRTPNVQGQRVWEDPFKYKNKVSKFLLVANLTNKIEFLRILKENFIQMEQEWIIDRLSSFIHTKVNLEEKVNHLKIWIVDDF